MFVLSDTGTTRLLALDDEHVLLWSRDGSGGHCVHVASGERFWWELPADFPVPSPPWQVLPVGDGRIVVGNAVRGTRLVNPIRGTESQVRGTVHEVPLLGFTPAFCVSDETLYVIAQYVDEGAAGGFDYESRTTAVCTLELSGLLEWEFVSLADTRLGVSSLAALRDGGVLTTGYSAGAHRIDVAAARRLGYGLTTVLGNARLHAEFNRVVPLGTDAQHLEKRIVGTFDEGILVSESTEEGRLVLTVLDPSDASVTSVTEVDVDYRTCRLAAGSRGVTVVDPAAEGLRTKWIEAPFTEAEVTAGTWHQTNVGPEPVSAVVWCADRLVVALKDQTVILDP